MFLFIIIRKITQKIFWSGPQYYLLFESWPSKKSGHFWYMQRDKLKNLKDFLLKIFQIQFIRGVWFRTYFGSATSFYEGLTFFYPLLKILDAFWKKNYSIWLARRLACNDSIYKTSELVFCISLFVITQIQKQNLPSLVRSYEIVVKLG